MQQSVPRTRNSQRHSSALQHKSKVLQFGGRPILYQCRKLVLASNQLKLPCLLLLGRNQFPKNRLCSFTQNRPAGQAPVRTALQFSLLFSAGNELTTCIVTTINIFSPWPQSDAVIQRASIVSSAPTGKKESIFVLCHPLPRYGHTVPMGTFLLNKSSYISQMSLRSFVTQNLKSLLQF